MGLENVDVENQNSVREKLNADSVHDSDVLEKILSHVGNLGTYQKLLIIAMMPFGYTYAFLYLVQIFITVTPQNHWCKVPELANLTLELRRNLSAPVADSGAWDRCKTFDINWTEVLDTLTVPPPGTPLIECQHGWEFEYTDIPYETVISEREWVCDRASYAQISQAIFFVGAIIGTLTSGWIADRFGRVPAIIGTNLLGGVGSIASTFTTATWDFILCRFIVGLAFDNCFMLISILVLEFVGSNHRTLVANIFMASTFSVAAVALPWLALYIANWRLLIQLTSMPMFLVIFAKWFLPESVRWLVSQGRIKEAALILKRIEFINKAKISEDVMDEFIMTSSKRHLEKQLTILDLFKSPRLLKAVLKMLLMFMGIVIVLDGLLRLSDTFGMDSFTIFSLNEASEGVSILLVACALDRVGRRNLSCAPTFLCAIVLFISLFMDKGIFLASLANIARFFIAMSVTTTMQWCTEILPTPFRATGASALHMGGLGAIIISSFIAYSGRVWSLLPTLIFISIAFVTSCVILTLPETNGQQLPQTLADSEKLIKNNTLCGRVEDSNDGPYKRS